jgi:Uma2 family endonuclease
MDTVLDRQWTAETFLAWEDQQEGKHEFDGFRVIPMTGGSVAHQVIVFNLCLLLARLLASSHVRALHEMRLRIGQCIRYPDVIVFAEPVPQTQRTLTDATMIFEVLSDDTAVTDRVEKLIDYADVPSLRYYIMLEQASRAAIVCKRAAAGEWTTRPQIEGSVVLPELNLSLPLEDVYQGLSFPPQAGRRRDPPRASPTAILTSADIRTAMTEPRNNSLRSHVE